MGWDQRDPECQLLLVWTSGEGRTGGVEVDHRDSNPGYASTAVPDPFKLRSCN